MIAKENNSTDQVQKIEMKAVLVLFDRENFKGKWPNFHSGICLSPVKISSVKIRKARRTLNLDVISETVISNCRLS